MADAEYLKSLLVPHVDFPQKVRKQLCTGVTHAECRSGHRVYGHLPHPEGSSGVRNLDYAFCASFDLDHYFEIIVEEDRCCCGSRCERVLVWTCHRHETRCIVCPRQEEREAARRVREGYL